MPIAYLWAKTIRCRGPGCAGRDTPDAVLVFSTKGNRAIALKVVSDTKEKRVAFQLVDSGEGESHWRRDDSEGLGDVPSSAGHDRKCARPCAG